VDDEISIPVELPVDNSGFLRRECPTCEQQFKWFGHAEGDPSAEPATQYFCPLCGVAASTDAWWTTEQLEYARGAAGPEIDRAVQDMLSDAFKGSKHISYKPDPNFTFGIPTPEPLIEPDDMVIVEPPCHPNEPLKVPEHATVRAHCLICGEPFAA
jgi:ribosomal protein S27E